MNKRIILASASPRRKKLLEQIGIPFEVIESEVNEEMDIDNSPYDGVTLLSTRKAEKVLDKVEGPAIIIGADTMIAFKGKLLGKPGDDMTALDNFRRLQGKKHTVYTGVCIIDKQQDGTYKEYHIVDDTDVYMRSMSDEEILAYIGTDEHHDKAGGYAIQGKGALMIERIDGDYNTVVGLPLTKLYLQLEKIGVDIKEYWK